MRKIVSLILSLGLLFPQSGLVYAVGELNLANYLNQMHSAITPPDKFQPARLRYISYDIANNDFKLLLDKGDTKNNATQELLNYFLIGLALPNDTFWVNLRPDAADNIIDPLLEKTDIGKIFLEADLQLKKDTASLTSPQNPEGKQYWDKLYKKAGELFGTENITIPTITRPWIVPNEVIVRETDDSAYIYKATLKVMLEEDYLRGVRDDPAGASGRGTINYSFNDPRLKELNEYSTRIISETIIPKLTKEVNSSKRYAKLRQVYYSLVLSRWFKERYRSQSTENRAQIKEKANNYLSLIDSGDLTNLASKESYDKQTYFQAYQKSFKGGEYNLKETVATPSGQSIRSYISGGISVGSPIMWGSFFRKGKDLLNKYIAKVESVMYTFMGDMDDAEVVRWHEELRGDNNPTDIDVYIAFGDIFSNDEAVTAKNFDKLIKVFSKADATLVFKGKKDFLISIALILERFKKKGEYDPKEIRKELKAKFEDLVMVYGNEMRGLINQDTLKRFFNNNKNSNFKKQLTELLDENKVIQAAELISRERKDLYNTNTVAARDLLNVEDNVLRIRDILNSEKPISTASPLTPLLVNNMEIALYVSLKDLNSEQKKKILGLVRGKVFSSIGAKAIPIVEMSHLKKMRFAVEINKDEWILRGILQFHNDNKIEDIMADSKDIAGALKQAWEKEVELIVSSSLERQVGGIDLTDRALHIKLERVGSFASTPLLLPQVKNAQNLDLDKEFEQIEALASSGIVPNSHRLLELFTVCHYRGEFGQRLPQIISCLKASSAIQEAEAIDSDEDFRLALMMPEVLS